MKIYTGRGDEGKTDLWAAKHRVSKSAERIEAYGTIDELISILGMAVANADDLVETDIEHIQHTLHRLMAQLADIRERGDKRISEDHIADLEDEIDAYQEQLPELSSFILAGGSPAGAALHHARAVCRRAERRIVALAEDDPVDEHVIAYINRLSDLLFVMARYQNQKDDQSESMVEYDQ